MRLAEVLNVVTPIARHDGFRRDALSSCVRKTFLINALNRNPSRSEKVGLTEPGPKSSLQVEISGTVLCGSARELPPAIEYMLDQND